MESLLLKDRRVLQQLLTAQSAMRHIPPDYDEEEDTGFQEILDQIADAVEVQQARVRLRERFLENHNPRSAKILDTETAREKSSSITSYDSFVAAVAHLCRADRGYEAPTTLVELLKSPTGKMFVEEKKLYLLYEEESEALSLKDAEGNILFRLEGEDNYEEIRSSLDLPWYGEIHAGSSVSELPKEKPMVLKDTEFKEYHSVKTTMPARTLIGKLFAAYYDCLDLIDRDKYCYREVPETDSIYLTLYDVDLIGFKLSNVAWPHILVEPGKPGEKASLREKGDWGKLTPFERGTLRERLVNRARSYSRSYFNPLVRIEGTRHVLGRVRGQPDIG